MQNALRRSPPADNGQAATAFEDNYHYLRSMLRRRGLSAPDAEDLVQDVLLVMWRRRSDYDPARPIRPWLGGIALRLASSHRRRQGREIASEVIDARDRSPDPEEELTATRSTDLILRALAAVPEKLRTVVVLCDLEGRPMKEVARTLDIPLFTGYSRLRMGRQALARSVRRLEAQATLAGAFRSRRTGHG
jgi:RNA polymerase sigma-70 factor (ECF subfamily)